MDDVPGYSISFSLADDPVVKDLAADLVAGLGGIEVDLEPYQDDDGRFAGLFVRVSSQSLGDDSPSKTLETMLDSLIVDAPGLSFDAAEKRGEPDPARRRRLVAGWLRSWADRLESA